MEPQSLLRLGCECGFTTRALFPCLNTERPPDFPLEGFLPGRAEAARDFSHQVVDAALRGNQLNRDQARVFQAARFAYRHRTAIRAGFAAVGGAASAAFPRVVSYLQGGTPSSEPQMSAKRSRVSSGARPSFMNVRGGRYNAPLPQWGVPLRGYYRRQGKLKFIRKPGGSAKELKYLDTSLSSLTSAPAGWTYQNLNIVPQGDTATTRVGRRIFIKSLQVRFHFRVAPDIATGDLVDHYDVRVIIFVDHQTNGSAAVATDFLDATLGSAYDQYKRLDNSRRFTFIADKRYVVNATHTYCTDSSTANLRVNASELPARSCDVYKELNLPIDFQAGTTTGLIGTQRMNSICMAVFMGAGPTALIPLGISRIRYTD